MTTDFRLTPEARRAEKRPKISCEERREAFLKILNANPEASRKEIRNLCGTNYVWLRNYDKQWFRKYQPPVRKPRTNTYRGMSLEQRRGFFLEVLNQNPMASRKELKGRCEASYAWLLKNDYEWLKDYLPPIRSNNK